MIYYRWRDEWFCKGMIWEIQMTKTYKNKNWLIREDEEGHIASIVNPNDPYTMNWAEGTTPWGTVILPEGLECTARRQLFSGERETFQEEYRIRNGSPFPVFTQKDAVGIYLTFNDNYTDAETCLTARCHTHLFAGGTAGYIMALRMNGEGPHLGMMVVEGSISGYSVERRPSSTNGEVVSNDRGDFILHPDIPPLAPGEEYAVRFLYFWFRDRKDFYHILLTRDFFPVVMAAQYTVLPGERIDFHILMRCGSETDLTCEVKGNDSVQNVSVVREDPAFSDGREGNGIHSWHVLIDPPAPGEYDVSIRNIIREKDTQCTDHASRTNIHTWCRFYATPSVKKLVSARCHFIAARQQFHSPADSGEIGHLDGAFLIYDNEIGKLYYDHVWNDHNAGRERVGMGALLALYLSLCHHQEAISDPDEDQFLMNSLKEYRNFIYRELFDERTGKVFNDIKQNSDWDRLYNYPWVSVFLMEMGKLTGDQNYLRDSAHALFSYYDRGGEKFYAIGIPMLELTELLQKHDMQTECNRLLEHVRNHLDLILNNGIHYPASEVAYEQSIVAPAVQYLLEGYLIFRDERYLREGIRQMRVLRLFNGNQPDYHLFENAIRHWDGYWFGGKKLLGDTFPHYWSTLTGMAELLYSEILDHLDFPIPELLCDPEAEKVKYRELGAASLRGCMNLFQNDGTASCAMVFPEKVNGMKASCYDPWANDQDWAMYYWLKAEEWYHHLF